MKIATNVEEVPAKLNTTTQKAKQSSFKSRGKLGTVSNVDKESSIASRLKTQKPEPRKSESPSVSSVVKRKSAPKAAGAFSLGSQSNASSVMKIDDKKRKTTVLSSKDKDSQPSSPMIDKSKSRGSLKQSPNPSISSGVDKGKI